MFGVGQQNTSMREINPNGGFFRMLGPHGAKHEPFARDFEKNKDLLCEKYFKDISINFSACSFILILSKPWHMSMPKVEQQSRRIKGILPTCWHLSSYLH